MLDFCRDVRRADPAAGGICEFLARDHRATRSDLDLDGNGRVAPQEVYQSAVSAGDDSFLHGNFTDLSALRRLGIQSPWILTPRLRRLVLAHIENVEASLETEGLHRGDAIFNRRLTESLVQFVRAPRTEGGLGIQFDASLQIQEGAARVYSRGRTQCLGMTAFLRGVFLLAGLSVSLYDEQFDADHFHSFVGVHYDPAHPERVAIADPQGSGVMEREERRSQGRVQEVSPLAFLASYHVNRAMLNFWPDHDRMSRIREGRQELATALRLAPEDPSVAYTMGIWILRHPGPESHRLSSARGYFDLTRRLDENYPIPQDVLSEIGLFPGGSELP